MRVARELASSSPQSSVLARWLACAAGLMCDSLASSAPRKVGLWEFEAFY